MFSGLSLWRSNQIPLWWQAVQPKNVTSQIKGTDRRARWTASSEFGTYSLCEQRRFRRACASAQSRQNLHCSLIQAVSEEEPSDRKADPWPLWMAGHAQLKFVMTECSKTQIRLTRLRWASLCRWHGKEYLNREENTRGYRSCFTSLWQHRVQYQQEKDWGSEPAITWKAKSAKPEPKDHHHSQFQNFTGGLVKYL